MTNDAKRLPDCRTCNHWDVPWVCRSSVKCVNADRYTPTRPTQLWIVGKQPAAPAKDDRIRYWCVRFDGEAASAPRVMYDSPERAAKMLADYLPGAGRVVELCEK